MHIADGVLPASWCLAGHGLAWAAVWGLGRRSDPSEVVRMGFLASATFVVSLIHFPLAGTSIHLGLFGLSGILLGRRAFPVIFATLLFHSLLFQHGGLLSLGMNAVNMGAGGLLAAGLWSAARVPEPLRAFLSGFVGILLPAVLMAAEFSLADYGKGFYYIAGLYLAVAAIEGLVTAAIVAFLRRAKPGVLVRVAA